jgi:hypothetical protein
MSTVAYGAKGFKNLKGTKKQALSCDVHHASADHNI